MSKFYVYEHWRPDRDECFYVGKGHGKRANKMSCRNRHHTAIQAKLSRLGMAVEVRMVQVGIEESAAHSLEVDRIAFWRLAGIDLANLTDGGEGSAGLSHMVEQRRKNSEAKVGKTYRLVSKRAEPYRGIVDGLDGSGRSGNGPKRLSRPVRCLSDGAVFESASAASRHYDTAKSAIIEVCLKRGPRQTAGGRRFEYISEPRPSSDSAPFRTRQPKTERRNKKVVCRTDGRTFRSERATCAFYKVDRKLLRASLASGETLIGLLFEYGEV